MKTKHTLSRLSGYIARHRKVVTGVITAAVLANIFVLVAPYLSGCAIDFIRSKGNVDFPMVLKFILILLFVYVLNAAFTWVTTALTNTLSNRTIEALRQDAFHKISLLPLRFFDNHSHGDVMSRLTNDIDSVSEGLLQGITQLFSGLVTVIGSLAFMFWLDARIAACVVVITILCIFVSKFIATNSGKMFRLQSQTVGELNGYIEEMVGNQKIVKAFGYEGRSFDGFEEINRRLYDCGQKAQFYSSLVNPTTRYINNLAYISVGVLGGLAALSGHLSVGIISSFLIYATQFARPINDMTSILTQLQSATAAAERIFAVMEMEPESSDEGLAVLKTEKGRVDFDHVYFSYNKNTELIKDLNIHVNPGETVAIVGPTGSGKTTIVNLLMRFYDVDRGSISIDGHPIDTLTRDSLRRSFGMVLQESWLFSGTVKENIAYGKPGATDEDVISAAKAASAHSFIKRLPQGYDTMITEDGGNLSQGQKQLLTIARAMLADPEILILDEATSSVDTMTEQRIQRAFLAMMEGRTSFVIAHRLSTIREADLILVMNHGEIIEQGTHQELLEKNGFYAKLYHS
jgi:ATP-binding cassette subfamily B multidrug efflux pump